MDKSENSACQDKSSSSKVNNLELIDKLCKQLKEQRIELEAALDELRWIRDTNMCESNVEHSIGES